MVFSFYSFEYLKHDGEIFSEIFCRLLKLCFSCLWHEVAYEQRDRLSLRKSHRRSVLLQFAMCRREKLSKRHTYMLRSSLRAQRFRLCGTTLGGVFSWPSTHLRVRYRCNLRPYRAAYPRRPQGRFLPCGFGVSRFSENAIQGYRQIYSYWCTMRLRFASLLAPRRP